MFSRIGQDEREVLEYVPSSFKVVQHIRPKLSCRACEAIVQAPMPTLPIERGRPGPGLLTQVVVSKYADHTPLHRQASIYARDGVALDRATLADWVGQAVFLLTPLAEAIGRHVRAGAALHADDTTVPVLAPGLGKTKTGRLWVVVRDERPWGSGVPPAASYRYSADRKAIHAEALLGGCRGFLHADGYAGFERLYRPSTPAGEPPLIEVACWSHTIRTQSTFGDGWPVPWGLSAQRDDMLDLHRIVMDNNAVDHQFEDRLLFTDAGCLQPGGNALTEGDEIGHGLPGP